MKEIKPVFVISNDLHLKAQNKDEILDLITQQCELAVSLGVGTLGILGDIFDSRVSQRQEVLRAFKDLLDIVFKYGLRVIIIPGNHDKTVYSSEFSFLDPFEHHPALKLITVYEPYILGGVPDLVLHFIPFFTDDKWLSVFNGVELNKSKCNILLSHIAVEGSVNNDGSKVSSVIKPSLLKDFDSVLLGHYHNTQKIGKNVYHLPSIKQNNFGEDSNKGFTVINSDGSHEIVNSKFKGYIKHKIDVSDMNQSEIDKLASEYASTDNNIRVELWGTEEKIRSLKKDKFTTLGIDVKYKVGEVEDNIEFHDDIVQFDVSTLKDEFDKFCDENSLNKVVGLKYLISIL